MGELTNGVRSEIFLVIFVFKSTCSDRGLGIHINFRLLLSKTCVNAVFASRDVALDTFPNTILC